jgi:hypothetical protein
MRKPVKTFLGLKLTNEEKAKIIGDMSNTTCRAFTDYVRRKLLGEPLCVYYRNRSYDDFTEAYIALKKDLDTLLEKEQWTEPEKKWLNEQILMLKNTVIQLYEYERKNKKKPKHLQRPGL